MEPTKKRLQTYGLCLLIAGLCACDEAEPSPTRDAGGAREDGGPQDNDDREDDDGGVETPSKPQPDGGAGEVASKLVPIGLPRPIGASLRGVSSISSVDLDGDGKLDVLAGAYGAGKVVWFRNLGDRKFANENVVEADAEGVWFTKAADLDLDGDQDVLVGRYSGVLAWYENAGSGTFSRHLVDDGVTGPWLAVGDLDGDGLQDLFAAPDGKADVFWYRGLPGKKFAARATLVSGIGGLAGIFVRDLNNDGRQDVVLGAGADNQLAWFINEGAGVLGEKQVAAGGQYVGLFDLADLDQDGHDDAVTVEYTDRRVAWYPGKADGTFGTRRELPAYLSGPYTVAVADYNGDSLPDIAIATYSSEPNFVWLPNEGDGKFGKPWLISRGMGQVGMVAAGDFDADGDADLALGSFSGSQVSWFENKRGEFATEIVPPQAGKYLEGQHLYTTVHFGFPVMVEGTPEIELQLGAKKVRATYADGSGTPSLTFLYVVTEADEDTDGLELVSKRVNVGEGSLKDPFAESVALELPAADLSAAVVSGSAPYIRAIERLNETPTDVDSVTFLVRFNRSVANVDPVDFDLRTTGDLTGTSVENVSVSGNECTVTVSTGAGSGVLSLGMADEATVESSAGRPLGRGFAGGEVYTLLRGPERTISTYYESGHGDLALGYRDETWELKASYDEEMPIDSVLIYGSAAAQTTRPSGDQYDFFGVAAGESLYAWPEDGSVAGVPELGVGGSGITGGTFATYYNDDTRIAATGAWVEARLLAVRGPDGGHFSVYRENTAGVRTWLATADGISTSDALYILEGSHQHFSFAFTKAGHYEVDLVLSGFRDWNGNGAYDPYLDTYVESGVQTVYFGVDVPGGPAPYTVPAGMSGRP